MRGIRSIYLFFAIMGILLVPLSHAGKDVKAPPPPPVITEKDVEVKKELAPPPIPAPLPPPPKPSLPKPPAPKKKEEAVRPPVHDEDLFVERRVVREEVEYYEPAPRSQFSLNIGYSFGRSLGCMVPNCGAFVPVQRVCGGVMIQGMPGQCLPPGYRPVVYQDVYVNEHPGMFQMRGCPCMGQMGCGCGAQTQVMIVNNVPPMPIVGGWQGLSTRTGAFVPPVPQAVFQVPSQQPMNLNHRQGGFTPRMGFDYSAGL